MSALEIIVAIVLAIALAGTLLPVLPGVVLIAGATLVWAISIGGVTAWTFFAAIAVVLLGGQVVKYLVPGRRLAAHGVPATTLWIGAAGGVIGFFVVPVIGAFAGFPIGIYLAERLRLGGEAAWPATVAALKAVGLSVLIEFTAGVFAVGLWVAGVLAT